MLLVLVEFEFFIEVFEVGLIRSNFFLVRREKTVRVSLDLRLLSHCIDMRERGRGCGFVVVVL